MRPIPRTRILWLLAALSAAYALMNVVLYYATGTFGTVWFAVSLAVYGALLAAALGLALTEASVPAAVEKQLAGAVPGDATFLERRVIYRSPSGLAVRLTYLRADGEKEVRHFVFTPGETLPLHEVEAHLDAFPPLRRGSEEPALDAAIDAALARRAAPILETAA